MRSSDPGGAVWGLLCWGVAKAMPGTHARASLSLLVTSTFIGVLSTTILVPGLPAAARALSVPYAEVQWAVSMPMLAIAISLLFLGPLADAFGRRPVILVGLCIYVLGGLLAAAAWTAELLVAGCVIQGAGAAAAVAIPRAAVRDLFSGTGAARGMAMITAAYALASVMAQCGGAYLVSALGWRGPMVATALLGAVLLAWLACRFGESVQTRARTITARGAALHYGRLLADGRFLAYCAICAGSQAGFFAFLVYAPQRCIIDLGIAANVFAWLLFLGAVGYFFGTLLALKLVAAVGYRRLINWGALLCGGGIALLYVLQGVAKPSAVIVPMALYCLGHGLLQPNAVHGALQVRSELAGSASSLIGISQFMAGMAATVAMATYAASPAWAALVLCVFALPVWLGMAASVRSENCVPPTAVRE